MSPHLRSSIEARGYKPWDHTPSWLTLHGMLKNRRDGTAYTTFLVQVEWPETAAESCADFLAFVDTFIMPLLPSAYRENALILADADHKDYGRNDAAVKSLRLEQHRMESDIRFVFGFDS